MDRRTKAQGFTLIEMLVVLAILAILIGLVSTGVVYGLRYARESNTAGLIGRIKLAMDQYHSDNDKRFPSGPPNFPNRWPDPYDKQGVELDAGFLDTMPGQRTKFNPEDFDPNDKTRFVDAWGNRIRYRYHGDGMLVWSTGPDGVDDIGKTDKKSAEDDISSEDRN